MKRAIVILILTISAVSVNAQTATNFNCADCNGVMHDLFTELDNGNVVVLDWVMPCTSCIPGSLTCSNVCASYSSNVNFYMVDDYANTTCPSLSSWAAGNNIVPKAIFSNAAINMMDYGSTGMPKVVVIGGANHTVFFNANNSIDPTGLQNAINQALTVAGVGEHNSLFKAISVYPTPAGERAMIKYTLTSPANVTIELYNLQGEKLQVKNAQSAAGENSVELNVESCASGMYLVKVTDGKMSQYANVLVSH